MQAMQKFFDEARNFLKDPRFQSAEVVYKLQLQGELRPAMDSYRLGRRDAFAQLNAALRSPNQNIIHWRIIKPFAQWCSDYPREAGEALRRLWFGKGSTEGRFLAFSKDLADSAGLTQRGSQLCVTSTLLMGISATDHPPIRTEVFKASFEKSGYAPFERTATAVECYVHALEFLDVLIDRAPVYGLILRSRLEAQGVAWCVSGGWAKVGQVDVEGIGGAAAEQRDDERLGAMAARGEIGETEKTALVLARRGQGRFREQLIALWGKCALCGCRDLRVLRASHLKPWRDSSDEERLDPFNGLLLSAHFDAALDAGLITFRDDGHIVVSQRLSSPDRRILGIRTSLKLNYVNRRHVPYLRFHRQYRFE